MSNLITGDFQKMDKFIMKYGYSSRNEVIKNKSSEGITMRSFTFKYRKIYTSITKTYLGETFNIHIDFHIGESAKYGPNEVSFEVYDASGNEVLSRCGESPCSKSFCVVASHEEKS